MTSKRSKKFTLIKDKVDLKVGDAISWVNRGEREHKYDGFIEKIKDNGTVEWRGDCSSKLIYTENGNTSYGMIYPFYRVKATKIAKKVYWNNIEKEEDGWLYLKS